MDIYDRIRERRNELGLSQDELAKKTGYTDRSSIAKIEAGGVDMPQSKILAFAQALNTTTAYLMGWEDDNVIEINYKKRIPILGHIAAGLPILAVENIEGYENVEDESIDYALKVNGESMTNAGIHDGYLVYVDRDVDIVNGNIVIALINGHDATIKRFYQYGSEIVLRPENPAISEQHYKANEVQLLGKVVEVKFKVK